MTSRIYQPPSRVLWVLKNTRVSHVRSEEASAKAVWPAGRVHSGSRHREPCPGHVTTAAPAPAAVSAGSGPLPSASFRRDPRSPPLVPAPTAGLELFRGFHAPEFPAPGQGRAPLISLHTSPESAASLGQVLPNPHHRLCSREIPPKTQDPSRLGENGEALVAVSPPN